MRRNRFLLLAVLCAVFAVPGIISAQFPRPLRRAPRAWLVLSDGFGPTGGGLSNTTGFSQLLRASGTVAVGHGLGMEVSAERIQEVFPAQKLLNDRALNTPRADAVFASIAQLSGDGRNVFPSALVLGGGVARRPTNDPSTTRLTGIFQAGLESDLFGVPVDWFDGTAGVRLTLMPAGNRRMIYLLALTFGVRAG